MAGKTTFTQDMGDLICAGLSDGKSLRTVCNDPGMPCKATVFNWMRTQPTFLDQYTRAKDEASDALFDECQDIADNGANDYMEANDPDNPGYKLNGEHIQRSKLRIDTRKWMASKMKPKKYGDRQHVEHELVGEGIEGKLDAALRRAAEASGSSPTG